MKPKQKYNGGNDNEENIDNNNENNYKKDRFQGNVWHIHEIFKSRQK